METLFSETDRERIAHAIDEAEAATSAEIVPYVVVQSDVYPAARWRGGVLAALVVGVGVTLVRTTPLSNPAPYLSDAVALAAILGAGVLAAVAAGAFPPLLRALTPTAEQDRAVSRRALQAFVDEEIFDTRDRTGILLFLSLNERRIEVLADRGIDKQVDETAWSDVTDHIRQGIEDDRLTQGLLNGIERCGRVLDEHGIAARRRDENELDNRVRQDDG